MNDRRRRQRVLAAIGATAAAVALGTAAGGTASASPAVAASPHTWTVLVGAQGAREAIQTMGFYPRHLWVDQGDTVEFVARSAEIHTVSFLSTQSPCPDTALCAPPQGFDLSDQRQSMPQGGSAYDGSSYFNSGIMSSAKDVPVPPGLPIVRKYSLTFPKTLSPGTYRYLCLVHGMAMRGAVIVQPARTPYPYTQRELNRQNENRIRRDIRDGMALWEASRKQAAKLSHPRHPVLFAGAMDNRAMVMRFIGPSRVLRVGDRVTFVSTSMGEPHTVTFGDDITGCGQTPPCNPEQPWNVTTDSKGNEVANYPGRNGGFGGSPKALNSGLLLHLPPGGPPIPSQLTLTLTRRGSFPYTCALHDYMGMVGQLTVKPAG